MNFKPELVEKILAGQKTQTRRICSDNPRSPWSKNGCALRPGVAYAVCPGRGKPGVAKVVVKQVWLHRAGHIYEAEARAEGFANKAEFIDYWTRLHGSFDPKTWVWAVEFALTPTDSPEVSDGR